MSKKGSWIAQVKCEVVKELVCDHCTKEEAESVPHSFSVSETELYMPKGVTYKGVCRMPVEAAPTEIAGLINEINDLDVTNGYAQDVLNRAAAALERLARENRICPDCKNAFLQPFVCITCGAEKLYDSTLKTAQSEREIFYEKLCEAEVSIGSLVYSREVIKKRAESAEAENKRLKLFILETAELLRNPEYQDADSRSGLSIDCKVVAGDGINLDYLDVKWQTARAIKAEAELKDMNDRDENIICALQERAEKAEAELARYKEAEGKMPPTPERYTFSWNVDTNGPVIHYVDYEKLRIYAAAETVRADHLQSAYAKLLDNTQGTPCEQIRHQQVLEAERAKVAKLWEALERDAERYRYQFLDNGRWDYNDSWVGAPKQKVDIDIDAAIERLKK